MVKALRRWWLRARIDWAERDLQGLDPLTVHPLHLIAHRIFVNRLARELEHLN